MTSQPQQAQHHHAQPQEQPPLLHPHPQHAHAPHHASQALHAAMGMHSSPVMPFGVPMLSSFPSAALSSHFSAMAQVDPVHAGAYNYGPAPSHPHGGLSSSPHSMAFGTPSHAAAVAAVATSLPATTQPMHAAHPLLRHDTASPAPHAAAHHAGFDLHRMMPRLHVGTGASPAGGMEATPPSSASAAASAAVHQFHAALGHYRGFVVDPSRVSDGMHAYGAMDALLDDRHVSTPTHDMQSHAAASNNAAGSSHHHHHHHHGMPQLNTLDLSPGHAMSPMLHSHFTMMSGLPSPSTPMGHHDFHTSQPQQPSQSQQHTLQHDVAQQQHYQEVQPLSSSTPASMSRTSQDQQQPSMDQKPLDHAHLSYHEHQEQQQSEAYAASLKRSADEMSQVGTPLSMDSNGPNAANNNLVMLPLRRVKPKVSDVRKSKRRCRSEALQELISEDFWSNIRFSAMHAEGGTAMPLPTWVNAIHTVYKIFKVLDVTNAAGSVYPLTGPMLASYIRYQTERIRRNSLTVSSLMWYIKTLRKYHIETFKLEDWDVSIRRHDEVVEALKVAKAASDALGVAKCPRNRGNNNYGGTYRGRRSVTHAAHAVATAAATALASANATAALAINPRGHPHSHATAASQQTATPATTAAQATAAAEAAAAVLMPSLNASFVDAGYASALSVGMSHDEFQAVENAGLAASELAAAASESVAAAAAAAAAASNMHRHHHRQRQPHAAETRGPATVDLTLHCGVPIRVPMMEPTDAAPTAVERCHRGLNCCLHSRAERLAVVRPRPYDVLLAEQYPQLLRRWARRPSFTVSAAAAEILAGGSSASAAAAANASAAAVLQQQQQQKHQQPATSSALLPGTDPQAMHLSTKPSATTLVASGGNSAADLMSGNELFAQSQTPVSHSDSLCSAVSDATLQGNTDAQRHAHTHAHDQTHGHTQADMTKTQVQAALQQHYDTRQMPQVTSVRTLLNSPHRPGVNDAKNVPMLGGHFGSWIDFAAPAAEANGGAAPAAGAHVDPHNPLDDRHHHHLAHGLAKGSLAAAAAAAGFLNASWMADADPSDAGRSHSHHGSQGAHAGHAHPGHGAHHGHPHDHHAGTTAADHDASLYLQLLDSA